MGNEKEKTPASGVTSPESLNDIIRVSSPGIWLLLLAVIALLVGACVWGIFGQIESSVPASVRMDERSAVCIVADGDITSVKPGMTVKIGEIEGILGEIGIKSPDGYECGISFEGELAEGVYGAKIITADIRPISFILN